MIFIKSIAARFKINVNMNFDPFFVKKSMIFLIDYKLLNLNKR